MDQFWVAVDGCYHILMPFEKSLSYELPTVSDFLISFMILLSTVYHRSHSVSVEKQRSIPLSFWKLTVRQQDGLPINPSAIFGAPFNMLDTSANDASLCLLSFVLWVLIWIVFESRLTHIKRFSYFLFLENFLGIIDPSNTGDFMSNSDCSDLNSEPCSS